LRLLCRLSIAIRGSRYLRLPRSLRNRAVQDHLKFQDQNLELLLWEFNCTIVRAVSNGKEGSCDHLLELIDRKNVLLWSIFSSNRGPSLISPSSTTSTACAPMAPSSSLKPPSASVVPSGSWRHVKILLILLRDRLSATL